MMKVLKTILLVTALYGSSHQTLNAQEVGVWCDAEMQTDFKGHSNYVNLLYLNADYPLNDHLHLSVASISILKSREESLLDDLQTFSNIEADSQPFTLALAGISWSPADKHTLFLGIRNVNEDYFVSPITSLFLNSSCGIFPTLSCNMDIANYPLASMGFHYSYSAPTFCFQVSTYNGQGYDRLTGSANLWRVSPHSDGLFFITQIDWKRSTRHYFAGAAQHTGSRGTASGRSALWAYTEQSLGDRISFIADYSHAFGHSSQCTDFIGIGGQYAWSKSTLGLFSDHASFRHDSEWATELTYKYDLSSLFFLQASCQLIHHGSWLPVGMVRMSIRI